MLILAGLVFVGLSQLLHTLTYFQLLRDKGAVATGLLQSLRACLVFALSAALYCRTQASQCYTVYRGFSTLLVACGIFYYSVSKEEAKEQYDVNNSTMHVSANGDKKWQKNKRNGVEITTRLLEHNREVVLSRRISSLELDDHKHESSSISAQDQV